MHPLCPAAPQKSHPGRAHLFGRCGSFLCLKLIYVKVAVARLS